MPKKTIRLAPFLTFMKKKLPNDGSLDAGLLLLSLYTPRGETRSLRDIAFVCGVKMQNIHYYERTARAKMAAEFRRRGVTV